MHKSEEAKKLTERGSIFSQNKLHNVKAGIEQKLSYGLVSNINILLEHALPVHCTARFVPLWAGIPTGPRYER